MKASHFVTVLVFHPVSLFGRDDVSFDRAEALREKTQAEKATHYDEDKRKRLREGGLSQLASQRGQRMYPILPLPALSPADLQRMVQAPYAHHMNMAGIPVMGPYGVAAMPPNGVVAAENAKEKASQTTVGKNSVKSVPKAGSVAATGDDDNQKEAARQDQVDAEGNIIVTDSDVIAGRGGRR